MGKWVMGSITVVLGLLAAYATAKYRITDTFATYAKEVKQSCEGRGAVEITAEQVAAKARAAAERSGVELLELRVTVEPLTAANAARAGVVAQAAVEQVGKITSSAHFRDMPGGGPTPSSFGTLAVMNSSVRAHEWLWSEEREMESVCTRQ